MPEMPRRIEILTSPGIQLLDIAVEAFRLENTRRLIEQGLPMSRVALRCGSNAEETMRRAFLRRFGTGPQAYRDRFSTWSVVRPDGRSPTLSTG